MSLPSKSQHERCACLVHYTGRSVAIFKTVPGHKQGTGHQNIPYKLTKYNANQNVKKLDGVVRRLSGTGRTFTKNTLTPRGEISGCVAQVGKTQRVVN